MPPVGSDLQRGGWYDVMDRVRAKGQEYNRFTWHDRKAWWQQEQGILAYLILDGILDEPEYKKLARESVAFYNAFFLDHDSNGVYFNVLATGIPYLMGTERFKGSHSMSGYHSTELCYLSAVYSNLLVTKQPLDLHFKPKPGAFGDNVLRVSPDILPPGSIKIEEVWIDGVRWTDFDAEALTVNLPKTDLDLRVKVRVAPAVLADTFTATTELDGDKATLTLYGDLDRAALGELQHELVKVIEAQPKTLTLDFTDLKSISSEGMRAFVFAKQKLDIEVDVIVVGATGEVRQALDDDELSDEVKFADAVSVGSR
jgi:anti-anti-sigma factor